ncbi:MAG TPA: ribose 5-phosphate isomerase B, partial [Polyangia bacterium]
MRVYLGSDHAGFSLRKSLVERLRAQERDVVDLGTDSEAACDYPEFAYSVANAVRGNPGSLGILVCATGQGMATAAGKVRGIRAVVPANVEAARLSRFDNDANVLCLGSRFLAEGETYAIVETWLATGFAGGRHARRIAKVAAIETASAVAFMTEGERLALASLGVPARIFDRDPALFSAQPRAQPAIKAALAWLSLPAEMTERLPELAIFTAEIRQARFKDLILLVHDAQNSPVADVVRFWGSSSGALRLHILGEGESAALAALEETILLDAALILVVDRIDGPGMGKTFESKEERLWATMLDLCAGDVKRAGGHFVAITCAQSRLAEIAEAHHYRKVFQSTPGIGEVFSALGFEGLVPAALLGLEPGRLLTRTRAMVESCRGDRLEDNPGASLGVLLGSLAKHGRNKLTLLPSKSLLPLGPWIAQVISLATGKSDNGIVVVWGERLLPSYPPDRIFLHVQADDDAPAIPSEQMEALHLAGQPYIQIAVRDRYDLGAELFRWEIAATVAALVLGTNPFPALPTAAAL